MQLFGKRVIQEFHWSLDDFMDADFYDLMEIMQASEDSIPVDPLSLGQ